MAVIAQLVASGGSTASFDFTSIPATYESLVLVIGPARGDVSATDEDCFIRFNNDSGSNYDSARSGLNSDGLVPVGSLIASTHGYLPRINGDTAPAGAVGQVVVDIPGYARTTFHKSWSAQGSFVAATSSNGPNLTQAGGRWRDTSAISRITIAPNSGNWKDGSVATLYGIPAS